MENQKLKTKVSEIGGLVEKIECFPDSKRYHRELYKQIVNSIPLLEDKEVSGLFFKTIKGRLGEDLVCYGEGIIGNGLYFTMMPEERGIYFFERTLFLREPVFVRRYSYDNKNRKIEFDNGMWDLDISEKH